MKTTVYIPCMFEHWWNIPTIFSCYEAGNILPDEYVIYLNGYEDKIDIKKITEPLIQKIEQHRLNVVIKKDSQKLSCNYVRSQALDVCAGEIIIMQDADDLPLCDRVRVIKDVFEKHNPDVLMHSFLLFQEYMQHPKIKINNYQIVNKSKLTDNSRHFLRPFRLHDGAHAVKKEFLYKCNYSKEKSMQRGLDSEFMLNAMENGNVMAIDAELYIYRYGDYHYEVW